MMKAWLYRHRTAVLVVYALVWSLMILALQIMESHGEFP